MTTTQRRRTNAATRWREGEARRQLREVAEVASLELLAAVYVGAPVDDHDENALYCPSCQSSENATRWMLHGPRATTRDGITWACGCGARGTVYRLERQVLASPAALVRLEGWLRGSDDA